MKVKSWLKKGLEILKKALNLLKSPEILVVFLIVLLFISGFLIYALNNMVAPSFYLDRASFKISDVGRSIELYVRVKKGYVKLNQFFVDDNPVVWFADKTTIYEGESSFCILHFQWKAGKSYNVKVVTSNGGSAGLTVQAPLITPIFQLELKNVRETTNFEAVKVNADFWAYSNGTDSVHILLFTYLYFNSTKRPIYIFYDSAYMPKESLKAAETIICYFKNHNITVERADYYELEELSEKMPRAILILINPLKDYKGKSLWDAAPAPLVDPNENGLLRDDSKYGKSHLYDWMKDNGLILITIGSLQPYKQIVYRGGGYGEAKDVYQTFDAHFFLTDAPYSERSIINGSYSPGNYKPIRVSCTLGLSYRETTLGFDKDSMEKYGLKYYAYGDYTFSYQGIVLNCSLPVFIRVGDGGWLAMGGSDLSLGEEGLAHDLLMMFLHEVWDSVWVPYGWYWDNGAVFYNNYGILSSNGTVETEFMPTKILTDKLSLRVVGVAYSSDSNVSMICEQQEIYRFK
jgi:hypothetical protein